MNKHLQVLYVFLFLILSSCFELKEQLSIRNNGSGTYHLILDLSKSQDLIKMGLKTSANSVNNPFADMDSAFAKGSRRLNQMTGISNAKGIKDEQNLVFGVQFEFADIKALNNAIRDLNEEEMTTENEIFSFDVKNCVFERNNHFYLTKILENYTELKEKKQIDDLLQNAIYTQIIRTSGKIKKNENKLFEFGKDKKEVKMSANLLEVKNGKIEIANILKFKK